ncbi:MAG: hypothetical protein ACRESO_00870 [Gammaproteobacteria bacterium]
MKKGKYMSLWLETAACNVAGILIMGLMMGIAPVMAAPKLLAPQAVIHIPGGEHGIGFDDIGYFPQLGKISIPAGQTGKLVLIDPATGAITNTFEVTGPETAVHGRDAGTSSTAYGDGYIFASDHGQTEVVLLDARNGKVLTRVKLASGPDYVRYLESRHELWVTEPRAQQIQVFSVVPGPKPTATLKASIHVAGGPEALLFDTTLDQGYTNLWKDKTAVIDLKTYKIVGEWTDSCEGPRGLALDAAKGFLFVGCTEGKVIVLDLNHGGKVLATAISGAGIDIISYNPKSQHLYAPGARSASMTIFKVAPSGALRALAVYRTAKGVHCVTDDGNGTAFVCDPHAGAILEIRDY